MPEQQTTVYKKWPKAVWESFCQEFAMFFSMAVSNTVLVDGVEIDSLDHVSHFGVCSTAAATQVKTVACPQFNLVTGARIVVGFTVTNTASSVQLNVNNTGAVNVVYKGSALPINALTANSIREFVYDGTNYQLIGDLDTTATGVEAARVTLFEGNVGNLNGSGNTYVALNDSVKNYDVLGFILTAGSNGEPRIYYKEIDTSQFDDLIGVQNACMNLCWGYYNYTDQIEFLPPSTYTNLYAYYNNTVLKKIIGIKYIQPDSYSTSEKLIGTWIDGNPLYRKVFANPSNGISTGLTSSNSKIHKIYGMCEDASNNYLPITFANGTNAVTARIVRTSGELYFEANINNYTIQYVAVEYTKITT